MGFPNALAASTNPRVYITRIPEGNSLPVEYTFSSDDVEAEGSTQVTLSLTSVAGVAVSGGESVELEHDQPILMPTTLDVAIDGTFAAGSYTLNVDDGEVAPAAPAGIAIGDYFTIASDPTVYRVTGRTAISGGLKLRCFPELASSPADNAVVTFYNLLRLDLPSGTQFVDVSTAGVAVNVVGATYAMASAATSPNTYAFRQLIGVESSSPTVSVETTDVATNTLVTTLKGTTALEIAVEGVHIPGDAASREILNPFLLNSDRASESIYTRYESSSGGKVYQGPGSITEADAGETVNESDTYSFTMSISVGDDLEYWIR